MGKGVHAEIPGVLSESVWRCRVSVSLPEPESLRGEGALVHGRTAFSILNLKVNRIFSGGLAAGTLPVQLFVQVDSVTATDAWLDSVQFVVFKAPGNPRLDSGRVWPEFSVGWLCGY